METAPISFETFASCERLTPQVFAMNGAYYMMYAGLKGNGWKRVSEVQSGLAVARP